MKRRLTDTAIVFGVLFQALDAHADVEEIIVPVKGVTCPVCTHVINMSLRGLPGVKNVKISLATRVSVSIAVQPGAWIDPEQVFRKINVVGFEAWKDETEIRAIGNFAESGTRLVLTIPGVAAEPIRLVVAAAEKNGKSGDDITGQLDALRNAVRANPQAGYGVEITGVWRPATGLLQPATLFVTRLRLPGHTERP